MSGYIKTMNDLEASTYGRTGGSGNALLKAAGVVGGLGGAGHDGQTAFSGASTMDSLYNVLFGQKVWSMLNQEVNALSMIAKRPYTSSGWRVLKSRPQGGAGSSFALGTGAAGSAAPRADLIGGVAENATLASIQALAPEYTTLQVSPKTIAHKFEFSELAMELAAIDDGVGDIRAIIREDMGKHHAEVQNKMLLTPLETYSASGITGLTNNYTSLYKVVTSGKEIGQMYTNNLTFVGANDSNLAVPVALKNIFGTNRAVSTTSGSDETIDPTTINQGDFLDAEVDFGASYGSNSARALTLTLLNDMIRKIRQNGGNPKVIMTGYDTIQTISDLLQSQERFMDRKEIVPTHNGVRGVKGAEVGFRVATYYDIPIIPCKDMASTTAAGTTGGLSDIFILDTDHLWLSVMKPTEYFEDGISNGNPFGVGTLGNQAMYRTIAEVCCSFFKGQGKITNLKSA